MRKFAVAALAFCLVSAPAWAQAPASDTVPVRIRGTVEKLDGQNLTVKSRDGQTMTVALAPNYVVSAYEPKKISDVKTNDFVASTGVKGTDGKLHCVELRIFPESLRGAGEGQYAWDLMPDSTMTNATVTGIASAANGETLKVKYKDKESEFVADADCKVFGYVQGDPGLLKPGAAVFVVAQKKPDGSMTAPRVTAERDGVKPPM